METLFTLSPGGIAFAGAGMTEPTFYPWGAIARVRPTYRAVVGHTVVLAFFATVDGEPSREIRCTSSERAREVYELIVREMGGRL